MNSRHLIADDEMDEAEREEEMEGAQRVLSQSSASLGEEIMGNLEAQKDYLSASQYEEEVLQAERAELKRQNSFAPWRSEEPAAGKQPRSTWLGGEDDELVLDSPDLADYFSQFEGISEHSQIAICRTYANYLAAKQKRSMPQTKRAKKC